MTHPDQVILEAQGIVKQYPHGDALNIARFKLYEGRFNFLIGPNGSGKTTLLRILSLVDTDYDGRLYYRGKPLVTSGKALLNLRRRFSVIWQNPYLYRGTGFSNIALPLRLRRVETKEITTLVHQLAARLHIGELLSKDVGSLSGGEKQKVSIARALITGPEILFIDEPTTHLDYASNAFFNRVFSERVKGGMTILFITHDRYQIETMAECITLLQDGVIAKSGPASDIPVLP